MIRVRVPMIAPSSSFRATSRVCAGDRLRELLERRRRPGLRELGQQAMDRLEQLFRHFVDLLDPHRRSLDIRRSLSTRPSVWHSGQ